MDNSKILEINKINAITEEVEASFEFIIEGIRILKNKKSAILNNHIELQLFASGFERLAKILLFLKHKHVKNEFPALEGKKNFFNQYDKGHGINKMIAELLKYSKTVKSMNSIPMIVEDIYFLENDNHFNEFMDILSNFSKYQRYYYIDVIAKKTYNAENNFDKLKALIYSYSDSINTSTLSYAEEDKYQLKSFIITIEKGVRAISRFFIHGLGDAGKFFCEDFTTYILLNDEDLGKCKYLEPKIDIQKNYKPWDVNSLKFFNIKLCAKSKVIHSEEYKDWKFNINKVKVYNYKNGRFCFVKIGDFIFALNGSASSRYKIPTYFASKHLKPRSHFVDLLKVTQNL